MSSTSQYEVDKNSPYKAKKFLLKIYPENVSHLESLESLERDQFVNDAISMYLGNYSVFQREIQYAKKIKNAVIIGICALLLMIIFAGCYRFLSVYSKANDAQMQQNFESLFTKYNIRN